jgi:hypothetical protein
MTVQPVIAADLALGKLVHEMVLHRRAHHFSVSSRNLVEGSTPFHFYETDSPRAAESRRAWRWRR